MRELSPALNLKEITTWSQPDVIQIPTGSLFREGTDWAVFVAAAGRARSVIAVPLRRRFCPVLNRARPSSSIPGPESAMV
jgi:hypothetical protein